MATVAKARHFDYLKKHKDYVEGILGWEGLEKRISWWRSTLLEDPEGVSVGCRKVVENLLAGLFEYESNELKPRLDDMIKTAEDEGIIGHRTALKCNEIKRIGNRGAHLPEVPAVEAKNSLILLDDILRGFVAENCGCEDFDPNPEEFIDQIILTEGRESASSMSRRASTAAALSEDRSIEREAASVSNKAKTQDGLANGVLDKLDEILKQVESLDVGDEGKAKVAETCNEKVAVLASKSQSIKQELFRTSDRIDEILGEYDYIKALLQTPGSATDEQMDVLAFPKTSNTKSDVLKLCGVAGSGKTLCLLAKLIRNVRANEETLYEGSQPHALFVCFNKNLARHIDWLIERCTKDYPFARDRIQVQSFDMLINSLVKPKEKVQAPHPFDTDARFEEYEWSIHYETLSDKEPFAMTKDAMERVGKRYPAKAREYYLDFGSGENASWMAEEIRWLAGVYDGSNDAQKYLEGAPRTGRGGKHKPSEEIRKIIVEVWREYEKNLRSRNLYTLEQALWRLLKAERLPKFDAIAVDETQDLSALAVRVLYKMKADSKNAFMYIAGDEKQKIYHKDFTFKDLDDRAVGYTITLNENKRNSKAIEAFANRLIGSPVRQHVDGGVYVGQWADEVLAQVVRKSVEADESIAIIGPQVKLPWELRTDSHVRTIGALSPKGLEFDNVIVNYVEDFAETPEEEQMLRYVHFTRARKRLYVRLSDEAPALMREYYPDYLEAM